MWTKAPLIKGWRRATIKSDQHWHVFKTTLGKCFKGDDIIAIWGRFHVGFCQVHKCHLELNWMKVDCIVCAAVQEASSTEATECTAVGDIAVVCFYRDCRRPATFLPPCWQPQAIYATHQRCVNPGQSEVWYDSGPSKVCCCDSGPSKVCWYDSGPSKVCWYDSGPSKVCWYDSGQSKVCWYDSGPSKVCWDDSDPYLLSASRSWFKSWVCFRCSFQLCVCGQIWLCVCTPLHLHVGADLTVFASLSICV